MKEIEKDANRVALKAQMWVETTELTMEDMKA